MRTRSCEDLASAPPVFALLMSEEVTQPGDNEFVRVSTTAEYDKSMMYIQEVFKRVEDLGLNHSKTVGKQKKMTFKYNPA